MKRRTLIVGLGSAAAWPIAARAQQRGTPMIGLLSGGAIDAEFYTAAVANIRQGLSEVGFLEGRNLIIDYRSANGRPERLPGLATEFVRRPVTLIIAIGGAGSALAAKAATSIVPIVFAMGADAVEVGLVKNLNRPEANITGISLNSSPLVPRQLDLLHQLVPRAKVFGYLTNRRLSPSTELSIRDLMVAAQTIGITIIAFDVGTEAEIDRAFASMVQQHTDALIVPPDAYLATRYKQIIALAARDALPSMYAARVAVMEGGLISYSPKYDEMYHMAGVYAGRILKGEKPGDLPVMLPTRFEFVINMGTAKALNLMVPLALQISADELID